MIRYNGISIAVILIHWNTTNDTTPNDNVYNTTTNNNSSATNPRSNNDDTTHNVTNRRINWSHTVCLFSGGYAADVRAQIPPGHHADAADHVLRSARQLPDHALAEDDACYLCVYIYIYI